MSWSWLTLAPAAAALAILARRRDGIGPDVLHACDDGRDYGYARENAGWRNTGAAG